MTRRAVAFHAHEQRVGIAIEKNFMHALKIAGSRALLPQRLATAAIEPTMSRGQSFFQTRAIHVSEHEHAAGEMILQNRGHESGRIEFDLIEQCRLSKSFTKLFKFGKATVHSASEYRSHKKLF